MFDQYIFQNDDYSYPIFIYHDIHLTDIAKVCNLLTSWPVTVILAILCTSYS